MSERRWVDVTERAIYLRAIPVTAQLPASVVHAVANHLTDRELSPGERLMTQGRSVKSMHLLTEGRVGLFKDGVRIGEMAPPQSVGFLNIIARSDAPYDAIAETKLETLELTAERLMGLLEDQEQLLSATIHYAAERLLSEMQELPAKMLGIPPEVIPIEVPDRALDLVERVFFLRCMSAFKRTNLSALSALADQMVERRAAAGSELFAAGEIPKITYFVIRGTVECETPDGRSFGFGPGTAVGGVEAIAGKPRWYTARASSDVVMLEGRASHLLDMIEDNFEMGMDFVGALVGGLQGILAAKAAMGVAAFAVKRDVSNLGAVPVGA